MSDGMALPKAAEAVEWAEKQLDKMIEAGVRVTDTARKAKERLESLNGRDE